MVVVPPDVPAQGVSQISRPGETLAGPHGGPVGAAPVGGPVPPGPRRKQKLIYILGTGRCGSTVFEIVLGSHPKIQATGEFHGIPFPKWMPGTICSCGLTFNLCPFWSPVSNEYHKYVDFDEQLASQARFEYYRCLPRSLSHRLFGTKAIRKHARGMADLIHVISQCSGKEIVAESSKSAARGYMYSRARSSEFDVYYIHLVRDGRGYMYSKTSVPDGAGYGKRRLVLSPWELTLRWVAPNLLAMLLCSRPRNRYLRVRYEDFVERPAEVLEQVGKFVGVDMAPVIENVRQGRPIPVSHLIGGNRLRFNSTITLETRFAKRALGSRKVRWTFWALGGWMAFLYGYLPRGRPGNDPAASG
jgi:Sulfotransferase domain